jgi:uncharacterized membrane protein
MSTPRTIEQYLEALRAALAGADRALIQDALYDAEEYLRAEVAQHPEQAESDILERIATTYGAPEEVADAYRTTEATVSAALKRPSKTTPERGLLRRFFGVWADSHAWLALLYLLLALFSGIFYFTVTAIGISLSLGLAILIIGVPFFLLFIGLTRALSLAEGRLVEALLGVRMPRRPARSPAGSLWVRIKNMLLDWRTWTTLVYLAAMLPLGVVYFVVAIVGGTIGLATALAPVAVLLQTMGIGDGMDFNGVPVGLPVAGLLSIGGLLFLTLFLHLVRLVGSLHGKLARMLLLSRDP